MGWRALSPDPHNGHPRSAQRGPFHGLPRPSRRVGWDPECSADGLAARPVSALPPRRLGGRLAEWRTVTAGVAGPTECGPAWSVGPGFAWSGDGVSVLVGRQAVPAGTVGAGRGDGAHGIADLGSILAAPGLAHHRHHDLQIADRGSCPTASFLLQGHHQRPRTELGVLRPKPRGPGRHRRIYS